MLEVKSANSTAVITTEDSLFTWSLYPGLNYLSESILELSNRNIGNYVNSNSERPDDDDGGAGGADSKTRAGSEIC